MPGSGDRDQHVEMGGGQFKTIRSARDGDRERTFKRLRDMRDLLIDFAVGRHRRLDPDEEEVVTLSRFFRNCLARQLLLQPRRNVDQAHGGAGVSALDLGGAGRVLNNGFDLRGGRGRHPAISGGGGGYEL